MLAAQLALGWRVTLVIVSGVAGGVANSVAGGGTFITFPTLLALGEGALAANVTTTVGVVPSYLGTLRALRLGERERAALRALAPWAFLGSIAGSVLLLAGSSATFRSVVPWLIGAATALFAAGPWISRRLGANHAHPARRTALVVGVTLASAYGGYFGAGLGIILLAVLGVTLPYEISELQALRSAISLITSGVAALIFVVRGHLIAYALWCLLPSTLVGGWLGARLMRSLSPRAVRAAVVAIGVVTTVRLAIG
jgi:uncharacterized membrane protein YfcA